jgi:hypothetical protein
MEETTSTPSAETKPLVCSVMRDPVVRMAIAVAMFIGFAVYCRVDVEDKPTVWDLKHINDVAKWGLHVYGPYAFGVPAAAWAVWTVMFIRRKLIADEDGIRYRYFNSDPIAWEDITRVDASKLKSKGIVVLHYGRGGKMTLDSWKLSNFKQLVALIETKIPDDKIQA